MEPPVKTRTLLIGFLFLMVCGCGGNPGPTPVEYSQYQGAEMARLALSLEPRPANVLLLGYTTPTANEFLSGVMKSCETELKGEKVASTVAHVEADLMALQTGQGGITADAARTVLADKPGVDTIISFAGLPQAAAADGPRWVVLSSDPLAARAAVETGRVRIAAFPRMGPPVTGPREEPADRFAVEYEVLRAP